MSSREFDPIVDVASAMRGYPYPCRIAGGWAIDLFVGRVTREHEDIEVGAFMPHEDAVRAHLAGRDLWRVRDDAWESWLPGDVIALPEFQIQARSTAGASPAALDIFLNPLDGDEWVSRRHEGLRVPAARIVETATGRGEEPAGMPCLVPEIQLLYKAKNHRPKDEADFEVALPELSTTARGWLRDALATYHPGDPWIARL